MGFRVCPGLWFAPRNFGVLIALPANMCLSVLVSLPEGTHRICLVAAQLVGEQNLKVMQVSARVLPVSWLSHTPQGGNGIKLRVEHLPGG